MKPYYEVTSGRPSTIRLHDRIREMEARATNILMQLGERNTVTAPISVPIEQQIRAAANVYASAYADIVTGTSSGMKADRDAKLDEAFSALLAIISSIARAGQEHDEQVACNTLADLYRLLSPEIDLSDCGGYDSEEQMSSLAFAIRARVTDPPSAPGGSRELHDALNAASYALFQIKRMTPEAVPEFAAAAHRKACVALDATPPHSPPRAGSAETKVLPLRNWHSTGTQRATIYLEADGLFTLQWWPVGSLSANARERRNCTLKQALRFAARHKIEPFDPATQRGTVNEQG